MADYYKIVREMPKTGYLRSMTRTHELALHYRIGKTIKPHIGKMFIFDSYTEACGFLSPFAVQRKTNMWIFRCYPINPFVPIRCYIPTPRYKFVEEFWSKGFFEKAKGEEPTRMHLMVMPEHTIWCDAVTLGEPLQIFDSGPKSRTPDRDDLYRIGMGNQ